MSSSADNTKTVSVSELKVHLAEYVRRIEEEGLELNLTRRGKLIARISPASLPKPSRSGWGPDGDS